MTSAQRTSRARLSTEGVTRTALSNTKPYSKVFAVPLDRTFAALADPHRRLILDRLAIGPVSVSALAEPLGMSVPGVLKHVRALQEAQLVGTHKLGRTRWCQLSPRSLDEVAGWIEEHRSLWERILDRFEHDVERAKGLEP
jgi:DNA-binding transcriptional ArsR family regulator